VSRRRRFHEGLTVVGLGHDPDDVQSESAARRITRSAHTSLEQGLTLCFRYPGPLVGDGHSCASVDGGDLNRDHALDRSARSL